jgi:hypothetical protein
MGQYFRLINLDKKEYVDPWDIGGSAKLWEWCANSQCGVIPFLLRRSSEGGGGDVQKDYRLAGRWAEDRIALVGDYDESKLFDAAEKKFRNISQELVEEFNDFIEVDELKLGRRE